MRLDGSPEESGKADAWSLKSIPISSFFLTPSEIQLNDRWNVTRMCSIFEAEFLKVCD